MTDTQNFLINQTQVIVGKFGSQANLARALNHNSGTTVQTWMKAGYIRPVHYPDILRAAKAQNVSLEPNDFLLVDALAFAKLAA